jgi:hypothetical protein
MKIFFITTKSSAHLLSLGRRPVTGLAAVFFQHPDMGHDQSGTMSRAPVPCLGISRSPMMKSFSHRSLAV